MDKKKGFTLIELLAVIVVLAVILVISVPKILEVIENAEKQAYKESAELMAHTAQIQYQTKEITGSAPVIPDEGIVYTFEEGVQTVSGNYDLLKFKGDKPFSGTITLTKDKKVIIEKLVSKNKKWCAIKEANEKQARVGRSTDPDFACIVEEDAPIEDKKACELEQDKDNENIFYIDSPSDLYALSQSVNSGTSYSGKTVKVRNNLDMSDISNTCGETSFNPIGKFVCTGCSNNRSFEGTFDGGAKTISNLTINRPAEDYIGLFGFLNGSSSRANVYSIIIDGATITGNQYVGSIVGYESTNAEIKEIIIKNSNISGKSYVGAYRGDGWTNDNNILVKSATVTSNTAPVGIIGGGSGNSGIYYPKNSIVENVVAKANDGSNVNTTKSDNNLYHSNKCIVNDVKVADGFDEKGINDLNFYETAGLDTWMGGDDNNTGYYFDYDSKGEVTLKSVEKDPFPDATKILTNGSGTKEDPYLVKNEQDWKKITAYADKASLVIKLDSDLDFSTNKFYMLGSSQNIFNGTLIGNDKTISNVTINGKSDYTGLIGYLDSATIYGLTIKNSTITGRNYTGIIGNVVSSKNKVNIYGIIVDNATITGNQYVGGFIGDEDTNVEIKEVLMDNMNVSGYNYVGGFKGDGWVYDNNILIKNATVISSTGPVGIISGGSGNNGQYYPINSIVENVVAKAKDGTSVKTMNKKNSFYSNNVKLNDVYVTDGFDVSNINNIYYYKNILETLFTGDANNTGYFFDYVEEKGGIYLVKAYTLIPPITEDTGESIGPSTGVCSKYSCTCECGCICNDGSDGATQTRCEAGCN